MDPILSALDKLREELSKAIAAQRFRQVFESTPAPVVTDRFAFTDPEDVHVDVYRLMGGDPERVLSVNLSNTDAGELCAHLSQAGVNALAQYLDQHRTDASDVLTHSVPPTRCDRARVGIGRCELNTGHSGTHRYCQHEWTAPQSFRVGDDPDAKGERTDG